jgi:simple sugar transport system permease protein
MSWAAAVMGVRRSSPAGWRSDAANVIAALVLTAVLVGALLAFVGVNPLYGYQLLIQGAFGDTFSITETLVQATPLLLAGLGVALAFSASIWNIGAEGQLYVGGIAGVAVGLNLLHLPDFALIPIGLLAGALAGALWALIAGVLKARFGAQEVLVTLMLNYIAILLADIAITGPWRDPQVPKTQNVVDAAMLPLLITNSRLNIGSLIALAMVPVAWFLLYRTVWGFRMRASGLNADAARLAGLPIKQVQLGTFAVSGALAGLAGAILVLGIERALIAGFSPGYGYTAIAVALLGGLNPIGILASSILFGALYVGGQYMQIVTGVPVALVQVITSILLLSFLAVRAVRLMWR